MESKFRSVTVRKIPYTFGPDEITYLMNSFDLNNSHDTFLYIGNFESNVFDFKYLRKSNITYGKYENQYFQEKREIIKEINFQVDLQKKILIIFTGKLQSSFVIRRLESILNLLIPFLEIEFYKIFNLFVYSKFIARSEQASILNFEHNQHLIGTFIVAIHDNESLKNIISEYGNNIQKIKFSIQNSDEKVTYITIDKSGNFLFTGYNEQNKEILDFFIDCIL